ncbi:MAG: M48 family metallopeptidase [Planctomycetota bacterium]|nr:M48 family metallopeptidase [Planctomycetota bacterium]
MWEQIRSNRRRSVFIVTIMGVLLVAMGMSLTALLTPDQGAMIFGGILALGLWFVMWMVTISKGDDIMLRMAGARQIQHRDHPTLYNIVEEMSIAAALPKVPRVFVVDDPSPNAFAAGRDPEKASVAVTTGLLRILDRDELQGVVAHELGHIKNRDVSLITTAGIMVGSIVLLAEIGLRVLWYSGGGVRRSRTSSDKGGGQAIVMIIAIALLILAPILAQLIYFALSRRREYLADASGAMYTRYPEGLASALEKLAGTTKPLSDTSRVTAPMYIVRPLKQGRKMSATSAFSTHPPIADRVRVLRSMAGGADFAAYDAAFQRVKGRGVVGLHTLEQTSRVQVRGGAEADLTTTRERARAASDAYLTASGYGVRRCTNCGASVKVPPSLSERVTACPRCRGALGPS